jgi:hypothetical protein
MDEELRQILETFKKEFPEIVKEMEKFGTALEDLIKMLLAMKVQGKELTEQLKRLCAKVIETNKAFTELNKTLKGSSTVLKTHSDTVKKSGDQLASSTSNLSKEMDKSATEEAKQRTVRKRATDEELKATAESTSSTKAFSDGLIYAGGALTGAFVKGLTGATNAALANGDVLRIGAGVMKAQIGLLNTGAQAAASGVESLGNVLMTKSPLAGAALTILGKTAGFAAGQLSELAKNGIQFMMDQTEAIISGFKTMTSVGAVYTGGMMAMTKTALSAGMTLDQFSKVVAASKDELSRLGLGVAVGSKKLAGAMEKGGEPLRKGLFALGMGMEEQAATFATVMAQMAGPAGKLNASNAEIAARTEEYAKNLKLLSDLTGEDMKAKQDKIRQENDTLAFQQKMDGMTEAQRINIEESMKGMSEVQRKALRERMIYGTIISKDVALAESTNSGIRKTNVQFAELAKAGTLNLHETLSIQSDNADEIHKAAVGNTGIAQAAAAGNEAAGMAAKGNLETWKLTAKMNKEGIAVREKEIKDELAKGKNAPKGTAGNEAADLQNEQQKFKVELQEIAAKNLPAFSNALISTIDTIKSSVEALANVGAKSGSMLGSLFSKESVIALAGTFGASIVASMISGWVTKKASTIMGGGLAEKAVSTIAGGGAAGKAGKAMSTAGRAMEGLAGGASKLGGIGKGAGEAIGGIMKGISSGLIAFANPLVAAGAVGFGVAIAAIGAGIAGAAWILGKALPTLAEGMKSFDDIDGLNLIAVGGGMVAIGVGLAAMGAGSVVGAVGNLVSAGWEKIGSLLGVDGPFKKLEDFSKLNIDTAKVKNNAEALVAFSTAMALNGGASMAVGLGAIVAGIGSAIGKFFDVKPPLDQLDDFAKLTLNTKKIKENGEAVAAFGVAMNALKGMSAQPGVFTAIGDSISKFFGAKPPYDKLEEFSKLNVDLKRTKDNAEAFKAFAEAMGMWGGVGSNAGPGARPSGAPSSGTTGGTPQVPTDIKKKEKDPNMENKSNKDFGKGFMEDLTTHLHLAETGKAKGGYNTAGDIGDGAGISFGAYQLTEKSGGIQNYLKKMAESGDEQAAAMKDNFKDGRFSGNKSDLEKYLKESGGTDKGKAAQDEIYKKKYLDPALKLAEKNNITDKAAIAQIVDHSVNAGIGGAERMVKNRKGDSAGDLADSRKQDYEKIIAGNPAKFERYRTNWMGRVDKNSDRMKQYAGQNVKDADPNVAAKETGKEVAKAIANPATAGANAVTAGAGRGSYVGYNASADAENKTAAAKVAPTDDSWMLTALQKKATNAYDSQTRSPLNISSTVTSATDIMAQQRAQQQAEYAQQGKTHGGNAPAGGGEHMAIFSEIRNILGRQTEISEQHLNHAANMVGHLDDSKGLTRKLLQATA